MVMPRSCSKSMVSRNWEPLSRSLMEPVYDSNLSARVDLPWSMWAMMLKLRMWLVSIIPRAKIFYCLSQSVLQSYLGAPVQHLRGTAPGKDAATLFSGFGGSVHFRCGRTGQMTQRAKQLIHRGFVTGPDVERAAIFHRQGCQVGLGNVPHKHVIAGLFPVAIDHRLFTR